MSQNKSPALPDVIPCGMNAEQLDVGLRILADDLVDVNAFWDDNITAFRQTLLSAIRETSDALLSPTISLSWRIELDSQLESLIQYVELADRYIERRSVSLKRYPQGLPLPEGRVRWMKRARAKRWYAGL
jgi:hypothetical protein